MDPSAYDRWWRNIIEKEEADYVNHLMQRGHGPTVKLTALGTPAVYQCKSRSSSSSNPNLRSSIVGSGMQVRKAQQEADDGAQYASLPQQTRPGSSLPGRHTYRDDDMMSVASSAVAGSQSGRMTPGSARGYATPRSGQCSYPRTPTFSATDSEVMQRLDRLEKQLIEERLRREVAERDIRELMHSSGGLPPKSHSRRH